MHPTFTTRRDIAVVGLAQPFRKSEGVDGPAVWRRFRPFLGHIPNRVGDHTFGLNEVVDMEAGELVYAPAVEVSAIGELPDELFGKMLEGGRFAVLCAARRRRYRRGFARLRFHLWRVGAAEWRLPARLVRFRVYDERFDPATLSGEAEIWVPVE